MTAILTGVRWSLNVITICISLQLRMLTLVRVLIRHLYFFRTLSVQFTCPFTYFIYVFWGTQGLHLPGRCSTSQTTPPALVALVIFQIFSQVLPGAAMWFFLFLILFMSCIIITDLHVLNYSCIHGIKWTWMWCKIFLMCCSIWFWVFH
jgi:hypothetical protein